MVEKLNFKFHPAAHAERKRRESIVRFFFFFCTQLHDVVEHPEERQKSYEKDEEGKIVPHRYSTHYSVSSMLGQWVLLLVVGGIWTT